MRAAASSTLARRGPRGRRTATPVTLAVALFVGLALFAPGTLAASLDDARRLAGSGQMAEAMAVLDEVLDERPDDVSALLLRGVLLSRAGRSDEAIEVFNTIARTRPDLPEPHNNLAVLYAAQGRYEEARGALVEAIRLQPEYGLAHENLGDVYAKLAALSYARANQIDPGNDSAADKALAADGLIAGAAIPPPPSAATPGPAKTGRRFQASAPPQAAEPDVRSEAPDSCVRVEDIASGSRTDDVARWFGENGMRTEQIPGAGGGRGSAWRVYIPPLPSPAEARRRVEELRASGITDLIRITDGDQRNGISLGVFASRESAERRSRDLMARGIESRITERGASAPASTTVTARGAFTPVRFARAFPDLSARVVDCP